MSIKIPNQEKRWKLQNSTDLFGNVYQTRNIDFDDEGLLKLSEASIAIKSETGDSNFDTPVGYGDYGNDFMVKTIDQPYILSMASGHYSITEDTSTNNPSGNTRSHAKWWQDRWYVTISSALWYATTSFPTWTDPSVSLTASLGHALEVFKSRNTLCIANGNVVKQIDTSHSTSGVAQLTLPSELEVTSLAYSNGLMAIGTKNKQTNSGSNGTTAFLFIWDGTTSSANVGISVDATYVIAVAKYQEASFVALTSAGQLLKFNGSGFDILANLPFYYDKYQWVDSFPNYITRNGIMKTEGDVIYINIPNELQAYGELGNLYSPNFIGGIYCYDPKVGLYHRYSGSFSLAQSDSIASINTTTDVITCNSDIVGSTGMPVRYTSSGTVMGGVYNGKLYYAIVTGARTVKLATTYANAMAGTAIDLTSSGTFDYLIFYDLKDFGQSIAMDTGAIQTLGSGVYGLFGHMIWGMELNDINVNTSIATMGITIPDVENRGYFITPRIEAEGIKDIYQKLYLKFKPLTQDIDKIVVKYRVSKRADTPISVPQRRLSGSNYGRGTWSDDNTFTTVADLSTIQIGDEVEITGGTGSGQTAHVSSLSLDAGTWTVNLDESLKYITSTDHFQFCIDNWMKLKSVDLTNTDGIVEIPLAKTAKWIQFKIELRGVGVTIEELQLISTPHLRSV